MVSVAGFFGWWIDELARVVSPLVAKRVSRPAFVVVQTGKRYSCLRSGRKGMSEVGHFDAEAGNAEKVLKKLKNQAVELRLDPDFVLDKTLSLPAAGQEYLDAILRHQMDRLTPWSADNVAYDYVVLDSKPAGDGQVPIRLVAASRDFVAAALAPLAEQGVKPGKVGVASDPAEAASPVNLQGSGRNEREVMVKRVIGWSMATAAVLLVLIGGLQTWRMIEASADSERIQSAIDGRRALIAEAVARTTASDEYKALAARKTEALPMVVLLEELSTTIPDDTYLTELNVEGDTVRINGVSREVTELISLLEDSDTLADAKFAAPTTRSENGRSDSFQILVQIGAQDAAGGSVQ